jgi:2-oxo-4-hydroxy-4-carboxy-5-ureidoimidazoline decarboxylase
MRLTEFNELSPAQARATIESCLAVPRWIEEVVAQRPYGDIASLRAQAAASAEQLDDAELAAALTRHPRIGEHPVVGTATADEASFSSAEQAGVDRSDAAVAERLRLGNKAYEERFDRVFLIRAAGRTSTEVLSELERRLRNDDETERREVVQQLREIALLRLDQVVA